MGEHETWQGILDAEHDRWQKDKMSYEDVIATGTEIDADGMVLAKLNYQVQNGGFQQWVDNGYGLLALRTIEALDRVGTPAAIAAKNMVERLIPYINLDAENKGFCGDYWIGESDWGEEEEDDMPVGVSIAQEMDDDYYKIDDQLMNDIEAYLIRRKGEN